MVITMNKELSERIYNDFPELFGFRDDMKMSLMAFGFDCGDGWFGLIYNLTKNIYEVAKKTGVLNERDFYVESVQEKYAGLIYCITYGNDDMFDLINEAETESCKICEICGDEGSCKHGPWFKILCDKCHKIKINNMADTWRGVIENP